MGIDTAIKNAQVRARKYIEATYFGLMTITEMQKVTDEVTKLTKDEEMIVQSNIPCKLSFESIQSAFQSATAASISQGVKIFCSPDITVKAGSKLTITQDNVTTVYTKSGVSAVYPTHQEITVELFEEYA